MTTAPKIAAGILSADFACLGDEVTKAVRAGADWVHVDVMDHHFVPNLTVGPLVCQALRPLTGVPLDVHLMVKPVDALVPAGDRRAQGAPCPSPPGGRRGRVTAPDGRSARGAPSARRRGIEAQHVRASRPFSQGERST